MSTGRLHNFGMQHESDKTVDPHHYLLGRERPVFADKEILGRRQGDAEQLFPRYAQATVTATGQLNVNGTTINAWTFEQLEPLSQVVLRQRANVIRNAVGEANCPPLPSGQPHDLIHWILHMQSELTTERGPKEVSGRVPKAFQQEMDERPIGSGQGGRAEKAPLPFGPRTGYDGNRDNYAEMLFGPNEDDGTNQRGIVSQRIGGEGRRHLSSTDHMVGPGTSGVNPKGIGSLRAEGEGKKSITCRDNLFEQRREPEAVETASAAGRPSRRDGYGYGRGHVSETSMMGQGVSAGPERPIGGERRRHAEVPDRMVNVGTANPGESENRMGGRRHLDSFGGAGYSCQEQQGSYQSAWRKDPSKLRGQPMLI